MKTKGIAAVLLATAWLGTQPPISWGTVPDPQFKVAIEKDWLLQENYRTNQIRSGLIVPPEADASGGCDGVINGRWGFHTDNSDQPWWQVDLQAGQTVSRIQVWNRCDNDNSAANSSKILLLVSTDGQDWQTVYRHSAGTFFGKKDNKPLQVQLTNVTTRFLRVQLEGKGALHLDEVEVFGEHLGLNLALRKPAMQSSVSAWSFDHRPIPDPNWSERLGATLKHCAQLLAEPGQTPLSAEDRQALTKLGQLAPGDITSEHYLEARWIQRRLSLSNPLLDFDQLLVTKRVPGSYSHMSDQYYGWWSRPGGGIFLLKNFRTGPPQEENITAASFTVPGTFLRPTISYDGRKVLFAWARHYPDLAAEPDKLNKSKVPEDAFFHLFEMNLDGTGLRQLTRGKYDDLDGRYLPDDRLVFLSTRRGQALQVGPDYAQRTLENPALPDCYVRCGGNAQRPVAVYTLHTMNADGTGLTAISPFEMFEWEPSIAHDGSILHARWDYIDRDNMPFMSLWAINPDGTNPRLVYKNYTRSPHCVFEPQAIPGSSKIIFTASGHHSHSMGSLVLLDPEAGTEGTAPLTRLTPEVAFPEIEGWPITYYASPWPLSERFHLVAWGPEGEQSHADRWHREGGRWEGSSRPPNAMGVYFFDAEGNMEMIYRDPDISTMYPIPVRPRNVPPVVPAVAKQDRNEGQFLVQNVYQGLGEEWRGAIKSLRLVAVPPKTQPWKHVPPIGLTEDDPGKCVLGTVPVEADGSANFRVPAGVIVFFQALDEKGRALQTMRSVTHVQPGQTVSCIGCHTDRQAAPEQKVLLASAREPSKIRPGPEGSWPLKFETLVQPVLDKHCVQCHQPGNDSAQAAKFDLTPEKAYQSLTRYGKPSLYDQVMEGYREGVSHFGKGVALSSALLALLDDEKGHHGVCLDTDSYDRLVTWMDVYAQKAGSFSPEQETELENLRELWKELLETRPPPKNSLRAGNSP